mmetsp:Transcript_5543/g.9464  ORF Transcript_5543/g.9464 Transcript_5543/m.9464 type:complete len:142 (-) Transcript_5543:1072-1497(-)
MEADIAPKLYPNETIYNKTNGITFASPKTDIKVQDGTAVLTTHRIIFCKGGRGLEIPLCFVVKHDTGGGIFHSSRIELFLNIAKANSFHPSYVDEFFKKVVKGPVTKKVSVYPSAEYHLKQFPNKDSRKVFIDLMGEALSQ